MTSEKRKEKKDGRPSTPKDLPPEGPHAREELIDRSKTPGGGALPDKDAQSVDGGSG